VIGLVGFGNIARVTARKAAAMGMQVLATDTEVPADEPVWKELGVDSCALDDLLERSDVVSLHLPLAESTRGLFGAGRIARMKRGAILVNSARGGIVDEAALVQALREGRLAGAALDVFEGEPLRAGSVLAEAPNLILTPHIAGVTEESNVRVSAVTAAAVARHLGA